MNPVSPRRRKPAHRDLARSLKNPHQLPLRIHLRPSRQVLNRPQSLNDLEIIPSRNNSQSSLTRSRHKLVNRQPFRDSVSDTQPSKTRLSQNSSIKLSLFHSCLNVSPERFRDQIRPSTPQLGDPDRITRSNPATLHKILKPQISNAHKRFRWRPSLWNTRDHKPCTSIDDRHVLHVVDRKVDPAFQDLLVDILVDYSSLFEREHRPTLARIASRLDYLSIDS